MSTAMTDQDGPDTRTAAVAAVPGPRWYEPGDCLGETVTMIGDAVQVTPRARRATGRPA